VIVVVRVILALLAVRHGLFAAWTLLAPRWFFDDFPLPGHAWVALLPPYNEHLIRDLGGLSLALTVVLVAAAWRPDRRAAVVAALALLAFTVPHTVFHAGHLAGFPPADAAAQMVGFGVELVLALVVLLGSRRLPVATVAPGGQWAA
jgi:hypothetical protein